MKQLNFFEPIQEQVKFPNGNNRLVDYGVHNEHSNYRIHVGYVTQHVYVFPTLSAKKWIAENKGHELKNAMQGGIVTAKGYAAPISQIDGMNDILIPPDIYKKHQIYKYDNTSVKGSKAVCIVVSMLKRQMIPLPVSVSVISDKDIQIKGTDIIIESLLHVQVKCDYKAGHKNLGGTGNVYLQIAECNPFKRY